MSESYEERQKRINRERQQRFRAANKERLAEERAKDREVVRKYKQGLALPPPPAPIVQSVPVVVPNNKDKNKTKKTTKTTFSEEVVIKMVTEYPNMKESTRTEYIKTVKKLFRVTKCPDLASCLKNFDKIKHEIETAKQVVNPTEGYGLNSKKTDYQIILWLIDHLHITIPPETRQKYNEIFAVYQQKSIQLTKEKENNKNRGQGAVPPIDTIMKTVEAKFGENSKQNMVANFYRNAPMRDDFAGLIVISSIRKNENSETNYAIVPTRENQKCTLVIQKYKTQKLYGVLKFQLDDKTSTILRNYIKKKKIEYDKKLFPEYTKDVMSSYISTFMKKCGFALDEGGINFLRHSIVTDEFKDHENLSAEDKVRLSRRLWHSVVAQYRYLRQLDDSAF